MKTVPVKTTLREFVAFRSDGCRLAAGAANGDLTVWDTTHARAPRLIVRRQGPGIHAAAWNPSATGLLATASVDGNVAIWRSAEDRPMQLLSGSSDRLRSPRFVGWLRDGGALYCVTANGHAAIWQPQYPDAIAHSSERVHQAVVAAYSMRDSVAVITRDGWNCRWDPSTNGWQSTRLGAGLVTTSTASSLLLAVARDDGSIEILDHDLRLLDAVHTGGPGPSAMAFSGDSRLLVVALPDGDVMAFDPTGAVRWRFRCTARVPTTLAVAAGLVALGGSAAAPRLIGLDDGTMLHSAGAVRGR